MSDNEHASNRLSAAAVAVGIAIAAVGVSARCVRWRNVFTPDAVELVPADSHYYIRFAQRAIAHFPHFDRFDPYVNFPTGAEIYWPPLHTWIVAAFLKFGPKDPETAASFVDPAIAAVEMLLLGFVGLRLFGRQAAALILVLFALTPGAIFSSPLGNADHHVHEPFFAALSCLLLAEVLTTRLLRLAVWAGVALGACRLFTPLEPLLLIPIAVAYPLAALCFRRSESVARLAIATGLGAAVVLALSVVAFGVPRSFEYEPLSSFHPLFALSLFVGAASVSQVIQGDRRWWRTLILAVLFAAPLIPEVLRAAGHLGRVDPILAVVDESQPLSWLQARDLLSVLLIGGPLAFIGGLRLIRKGTPIAIPALAASLILLVPALQQNRFIQALIGAVIVLVAIALPSLFDGQPRAKLLTRAMYLVGGGTLLASLVPPPRAVVDTEIRLARPTMKWIRDRTPKPSADPMGDAKPDYAVVANPLLGHFLNFWAERPNVSSVFSQAPVHTAGNERAAKVFSAMFEEDAYQAAVDTGAKYLLVTPLLKPFSLNEIDYAHSYLATLLESADMSRPGSSHFRLIYDSPEQRIREGGGSYARVFEVVPGARLTGRGTLHGSIITARLSLYDGLGRRMEYIRSVRDVMCGNDYDDDCECPNEGGPCDWELRVAYSTDDHDSGVHLADGDFGYEVEVDGLRATVAVSSEAIRNGTTVHVTLSSQSLPDSGDKRP